MLHCRVYLLIAWVPINITLAPLWMGWWWCRQYSQHWYIQHCRHYPYHHSINWRLNCKHSLTRVLPHLLTFSGVFVCLIALVGFCIDETWMMLDSNCVFAKCKKRANQSSIDLTYHSFVPRLASDSSKEQALHNTRDKLLTANRCLLA